MIIKCCGKVLEYIGATVGGTALMGCPKCRKVFWLTFEERTTGVIEDNKEQETTE